MKEEKCRCGALIVPRADGSPVCPECGREPTRCRCRPLVRAWDPELLELEEFEHACHHGVASDVAEIAERLEVPAYYLRMALRDADWADEAIDEIVAESCGWNRRIDDELRHDQPKVPTHWAKEKTMAKKEAKVETVIPEVESPEAEERPVPSGPQPRASWLGIPIFNPTAALLVEKISHDVDEKRLDPTTIEGRMEIVEWTRTILLQEQVLGQSGFILRTLLGSNNRGAFFARLLGRIGPRAVGGVGRPMAKVSV